MTTSDSLVCFSVSSGIWGETSETDLICEWNMTENSIRSPEETKASNDPLGSCWESKAELQSCVLSGDQDT